ncbi:MAG: MaoC/PaaZ C-terminal domain-containing protein [Isosphaeraceae bacterium]
MTPKVPSILAFDDLNLGDEWESPGRTVTEADVVNFAGVSGDFNPIHVDHHQALQGAFRRPVAHGLLGLSIASGLTANAPRVETIAFLCLLEWKFLQPIFFGDTIRVRSRVQDLQARSRGRRGVVTWHRRIINQQDQIVQEGLSQTLVRGRADSSMGSESARGSSANDPRGAHS